MSTSIHPRCSGVPSKTTLGDERSSLATPAAGRDRQESILLPTQIQSMDLRSCHRRRLFHRRATAGEPRRKYHTVVPDADFTQDIVQREKVDQEIEAVIRAARVFSAITAEAIAQAGEAVTLPQLRVLTLASTTTSLNNGQVARALDVHISNASRLCERLVQAGLLSRRDLPHDRRQVELTLTDQGRQLIDRVTDHRRIALRRVLQSLPDSRRSALARALSDFTEAAHEHIDLRDAFLP